MGIHQKGPPEIDSKTLLQAYSRALLYAERRMLRFKNSALGARLSAQDATHESVMKVLSGERPWNPEAVPDLFVHLAGCINSVISNAYLSQDYKSAHPGDPEDVFHYTAFSGKAVEDEVDFESSVTFVIDFIVEKREDLKEVAELMFKEGVTKPQKIADRLGMPVQQVNTMKLSIRRIFNNVNFAIHYISKNRQDLIEVLMAMHNEKITCNATLSERLKIPATEVNKQRREINRVIEEIHRGSI